jgi:hypothetical protein
MQRQLSPKQIIFAFLLALAVFTTMACGNVGDATCVNCEIPYQGGF